jgi:hypothetical protein
VETKLEIGPLEATLYRHFDPRSQLMNGTVPIRPSSLSDAPEPTQRIQVMSNTEIQEKRDPVQRLPRQAAYYAQIVGHFLAVKESMQIARAMGAHFQRLSKYHEMLLGFATSDGPVTNSQTDLSAAIVARPDMNISSTILWASRCANTPVGRCLTNSKRRSPGAGALSPSGEVFRAQDPRTGSEACS